MGRVKRTCAWSVNNNSRKMQSNCALISIDKLKTGAVQGRFGAEYPMSGTQASRSFAGSLGTVLASCLFGASSLLISHGSGRPRRVAFPVQRGG